VGHNPGDHDSAVNPLLANAESWDATQTEFVLILLCAGGIACVCALVSLIVIVGKRKRHPYAPQLTTAAMFWGLISVASIVYVTITQLTWAKENYLELLSGYGNPGQSAPGLPWIPWGVLSAAYLVLLGWTALR